MGAVIVDANRRIVSQGYNGFPIGTDDNPAIYDDRNRKYKRVLHAEKNALLFAQRDLSGCTLYVTHPACGQCTAAAIQMGIARIVSRPASADMRQRWTDEFRESQSMAEEAGVILDAIDGRGYVTKRQLFTDQARLLSVRRQAPSEKSVRSGAGAGSRHVPVYNINRTGSVQRSASRTSVYCRIGNDETQTESLPPVPGPVKRLA